MLEIEVFSVDLGRSCAKEGDYALGRVTLIMSQLSLTDAFSSVVMSLLVLKSEEIEFG